MTVCGAQPPSAIGFAQCHEHLMISKGISHDRNPALCIDSIAKSAAEVRQFYHMGGRTLVDAQPGGCNRMSSALYQIAVQTGVHIIASTGFHKLIFYPEHHWLYTKTEQELADIFSHELTTGMFLNIDTDFHPNYDTHCAGVIKAALDTEGLSPIYQKLFSACCSAVKATEVPLMIHIEKGSDPLELLDYLMARGLAPEQIIFCHLDRAVADLSIHRNLLAKGCYLEYDTIGRFKYHSDQVEATIFKQMADWGFEDQLLFSLDTTRERLKSYHADGIGLDYLFTTFIPILLETGMTEQQIEKLSHDNFIQVFTRN